MSAEAHHHRTTLSWSGSTGVGYDAYDRNHRVTTDPPTADLELSSAPSFRGDPGRLDPEQLLVAAASSCQCLSFLAVAARARLDVVAYEDHAEGLMPPDDRPVRITQITLRPTITVIETADASATERLRTKLERLVAVAHRECFIANSLTSSIVIEPQFQFVDPAQRAGSDASSTDPF